MVSTTVMIGVMHQNASVMVIENAESNWLRNRNTAWKSGRGFEIACIWTDGPYKL